MDAHCSNLRFSEKAPTERADSVAIDANNEKAIDNTNLPYTKECLVDRLKQHLATVEDKEGKYDSRKYYNQAHDMLKIGAFNPVPPFVIYLNDLGTELMQELCCLHTIDRAFVLTQAIGRIFEDVNFEIYHNSVSRVLRVELVK
jgi:hypothetical protein